jgi:hypothetical protein
MEDEDDLVDDVEALDPDVFVATAIYVGAR